MALQVTALASGSNGNCYYVGNEREAVLVDAGVSCREIETRMARLGLGMDKVKAIFVSHEHADHIRGLAVLSKKHRLPVFATPLTRRHGRINPEKGLSQAFSISEPVQVGALTIKPFAKQHDAADPCSFVISYAGVSVGVLTDIGAPCTEVINHFKQCHAVFLETNYDEDMLANGSYPYVLKRRISGENGHLSNRQALELFTTHRSPFLTHLFLSHLSQHNNCPQLVSELFTTHAGNTTIVTTSRKMETPVYTIRPDKEVAEIVLPVSQLKLPKPAVAQGLLF